MTINYEICKFRKDGTANIRLLITAGRGNRSKVSTSIYVTKKDIKPDGKLKRGEILDTINAIIADTKRKFVPDDHIKKETTALEVRNVMTGKAPSGLPSFFSFARRWVEDATVKGKKNYTSALNSFETYLKKKDEGFEDLEFRDIDYQLLIGYCNSLADRPRAQSLYLGALRHLWEEADPIYDEKMPRTPFKKFRVPKQKPVGQRAVSIDVIRNVYAHACVGKREELARDCYLLSFCLMGMNAADLYDCRILDKDTIKYDRVKTRDRRYDHAHMEVVVPAIVKPLLEKYKDNERVFCFHRMFKNEAGFQRSLNIGLKAIFGKDTTITFYSARHSWATIARNNLHAPKSDVNDALVHVDKSMDVTDLYIMKNYSIVNELNSKVIAYTFGKQK